MRRGGGSSCPRHPRPETHLGRFAARGGRVAHIVAQGARREVLGHREVLRLWSDGRWFVAARGSEVAHLVDHGRSSFSVVLERGLDGWERGDVRSRGQ